MKELTKYSRLAMYLEKLFDRLNEDFFDGVLERPVITIQSTPRAYGHYTLYDAWSVKGEGHREINIGAGTLDRDVEYTVATLLHEMCHQYNDTVLNVQDCSRGGMYHNKYFKQAAEQRGLTVVKTEKYGFARTEPGDVLLEWILKNELQEIKVTRHDIGEFRIPGGEHTTSGGVKPTISTTGRSSSRRYICPCCHTIIRATRTVNVCFLIWSKNVRHVIICYHGEIIADNIVPVSALNEQKRTFEHISKNNQFHIPQNHFNLTTGSVQADFVLNNIQRGKSCADKSRGRRSGILYVKVLSVSPILICKNTMLFHVLLELCKVHV